MPNHHFISYSSLDGLDFALRLAETLAAGPPSIPVWLDKRKLIPGRDWGEQLAEAIRDCDSLLFVMTRDSVEPNCTCTQEWTRALKYKKPVIPLRLHADAELPFRLEPRQYIDFTDSFDTALAQLSNHLQWLASPAGVLQTMKDRLADARRDLRRAADPTHQARIQDDIAQLEKQIAEQERVVKDPQGTAKRVTESIVAGLEREREPERLVSSLTHSKFINPPPGIAPVYFQDRYIETKLLADFLKDDAKRLLMLVGRGGLGKTVLVCRLLKSLERGRLPDDLGPLAIDGIVYLSATGSRRVNVLNLYTDLIKLLPHEIAKFLDTLHKNPNAGIEFKMSGMLAAFPTGLVVLLLDNFEDIINPETFDLRDAELDEALRALLNLPPHAIKVIITTRIVPYALVLTQSARQTRLDLDEGLESPFAENILRAMDVDGKVGLKSAPADVLAEARIRTRGYPRALETLFAILSADRDTTLTDILQDTANLLPENVLDALVGEAFARLDSAAQKVMQALAVYARPVSSIAIDYLLQPYLPGINSASVLKRLVNMHFVRKEAGLYYLHPVDRKYVFTRIPKGETSDRETNTPTFTQYALLHRGAEYFKQVRKPAEKCKTIDDLAPQLAEFDLRCDGQDYNMAAHILFEIDDANYLIMWGHYRLMIELHERVLEKCSDPTLKMCIWENLGFACYSMGQYQKAITCYEQALTVAREENDRKNEGISLGGLGNCYTSTANTVNGIGYYEQALEIAREIGDRYYESVWLADLACSYADLGQTDRALEYFELVRGIYDEIDDPSGIAIDLANLAETLIDAGHYTKAIQCAIESVRIGEENNAPNSYSNSHLALANLFIDDLPAARIAAERARQYDEPLNNHYVFALYGVIALRQSDQHTAREMFVTTVERADELLLHSEKNYDALDVKGLAFAGLALCEGSHHIPTAIAVYRAARAINKDAGIVGRVLRLFDELAKADANSVLAEVRSAAAGEQARKA